MPYLGVDWQVTFAIYLRLYDIKTRMQLEPAKYTSFIGTGKMIVNAEGGGALSGGLGECGGSTSFPN